MISIVYWAITISKHYAKHFVYIISCVNLEPCYVIEETVQRT